MDFVEGLRKLGRRSEQGGVQPDSGFTKSVGCWEGGWQKRRPGQGR